jgi:hypothetical protein
MTLTTRLGVLLTVALIASATAPGASAWHGDGSAWWGRYPVYRVPPGLWHERPPYFAFHRPFYYGYPVYPAYGGGCCSRGKHVASAEATPIEPLTVKNEFVEPELLAAAGDLRTSGPLRIANPFVSSQERDAVHPATNGHPLRIANPFVTSQGDKQPEPPKTPSQPQGTQSKSTGQTGG